jgi:hypothetical protein
VWNGMVLCEVFTGWSIVHFFVSPFVAGP